MHERVSVNALCFGGPPLAEMEAIWRELAPRRISFMTNQVFAEGEVRQAAVFGEYLVLRRRIEAEAYGDEIRITDTVTNEGFDPTPHEMLYHINLGWPLLDSSARLLAPDGPHHEQPAEQHDRDRRQQRPPPADQVFQAKRRSRTDQRRGDPHRRRRRDHADPHGVVQMPDRRTDPEDRQQPAGHATGELAECEHPRPGRGGGDHQAAHVRGHAKGEHTSAAEQAHRPRGQRQRDEQPQRRPGDQQRQLVASPEIGRDYGQQGRGDEPRDGRGELQRDDADRQHHRPGRTPRLVRFQRRIWCSRSGTRTRRAPAWG